MGELQWRRRWDTIGTSGRPDGWLELTRLSPGETLQRTVVSWYHYWNTSEYFSEDLPGYAFIRGIVVTYGTEAEPPPFPPNPMTRPVQGDYLWWDIYTYRTSLGTTQDKWIFVPHDPPARVDTPVRRNAGPYGASVWLAWANNFFQMNMGCVAASSCLVELPDTQSAV